MNQKVKDGISRHYGLVERPVNVLSGNLKGYYTVISFEERNLVYIRINAIAGDVPPVASMEGYLEELKSQNEKMISCTYKDSYIEILVRVPMGGNKVVAFINGITDQVILYLEHNNYRSGCAFCGSNETALSLNNFLGTIVVCCDECSAECEAAIKEKQQEFKESKGNHALGLVGAILGSLIGFAVYFFIYQMGYIAVISGIVMSLCVLKGFELLGGKLDIKGSITCLVVAVGMSYVATRFACAYQIKDIINAEFSANYSAFDYFININQALDLFEGGISEFIQDLAFGCGSTLFFGILYAGRMYKERAFHGTVRRY